MEQKDKNKISGRRNFTSEDMSSGSKDNDGIFLKYDQWCLFIMKRTERLSAAVHLVTDLVSDKEPVKWRLRNQSIVLLSDATAIQNKSTVEQSYLFIEIQNYIGEVIALLEIAYASGLVSKMNFSIIRDEYMLLRERIDVGKNMKSAMENMVEGILKGDSDISNGQEFVSEKDNKVIKDRIDVFNNYDRYSNDHMREVSKKDNEYTRGVQSKHNSLFLRKNREDKKKERNSRRDRILGLVKKNGEVSIKDISGSILDCSEKTIQRELVLMVNDGTLKRTGEKRWSRYKMSDKT